MVTVFKYKLTAAVMQDIEVPRNGEILSVNIQDTTPVLWVKVDTDEPAELRRFYMVATGGKIDKEVNPNLEFIDTILMFNGSLVFHFFEDKNFNTTNENTHDDAKQI